MIDSIKRLIISAVTILLIITVISIPASAESRDDDPLVTLSYVNEVLKPQIVAEVLEQLGIDTVVVTTDSAYKDISAESGSIFILGADCELIYRGGGAVIITTSTEIGDGVTDMSVGKEFFSGKPLEFGHVYYSSESDAKKYILVTGPRAYFTIRGSYEIS